MEQELTTKPNHLETEKINILPLLCEFIDSIDFSILQDQQIRGRPKTDIKEIIKSLFIVTYHSWSYRRANSDLELLKEKDFLKIIPKRSTLNKYMNDNSLRNILQKLIELSSLPFVSSEECFMMDGSWFYNKIIFGGSKYKQYAMSRKNKLSDIDGEIVKTKGVI